MKSVLILGVGGTGSRAVNLLQKKILRKEKAEAKREDVNIVSVVFDTNAADEKNIDAATVISLAENATVGTVRNRLGRQCDEWFPADHKYDENNLAIGAGQWRNQSYLAFLNAMNDSVRRGKLDTALQKLVDQTQPTFEIDIYTVASLAGGTGSGTFIPLTLYVKKRLRQLFPNATVRARAMLACPDIYEAKQNGDRLNVVSIYANAYAILRELNAINQVIYGMNGKNYDSGNRRTALRGRTPVNFRLGSEDGPVGVLFDSNDVEYHQPKYAPFDRVYLMEKIINVSSIPAHDEAMANTLYSMICTQAGGKLDGQWSNEEKKRAGESGHNCMYAGVGSSEIRFPIDTLLDYFAWRKTRDDVEEEWLVLHNETESRIAEKRRLAREMRKEYHLTIEDYAKMFLDVQKAEERAETSGITQIIHGATRYYERHDGKEDLKHVFREYFERLKEKLDEFVPEHKSEAERISKRDAIEKLPFFASRVFKEGVALQVVENVSTIYAILNAYYQTAVESIRSQVKLCADAILPLDTKKDLGANPELSFVHNVLAREDKHIHPVAAMVQLCTLRTAIEAELEEMDTDEWRDLSSFEIGKLPTELLRCAEDVESFGFGSKARKSGYLGLGTHRFAALLSESGAEEYRKSKTDYVTDGAAILKDGDALLTKLSNDAKTMFRRRVLLLVAERVNAMIDAYRSFFRRFTEQKIRLGDRVKRAEQQHSASTETSCFYVGASVESRRRHYEEIMSECVSGTADSYDIAGRSVFNIAYGMAYAKQYKAQADVKIDATGVFEAMYRANREYITDSDYFQKLKSKTVIEVIADEHEGDEYEAGQRIMTMAYELAKPALRVRETGMQNEASVLLAPEALEDYLESNADLFGLKIAGGEARACVDELLSKWGQRMIIGKEENIPNNVLYICRAMMSVDSVDILKVNERNVEDGYYRYYLETIEMAGSDNSPCGDGSRYDDDSKLPHLGFNWHKRGYLPFINATLDVEADEKMVKALLYALLSGELSYRKEGGYTAFRYRGNKIVANGQYVTEKNLLGILTWLRPQEKLIALWSDAFDQKVNEQMAALPSAGFAHQLGEAKAALTRAPYLRMLRTNIFENVTSLPGKEKDTEEAKKPTLVYSVFDFAYRIKIEEEKQYDCNDAEKILRVVSDLLWDLCARVISPEQEQFKDVYEWERDYFVYDLYRSKAGSVKHEEERAEIVRTMLSFANSAGAFLSLGDVADPKEGWRKHEFSFSEFMERRSKDLLTAKDRELPTNDEPPTSEDAPASRAL